MNRSAISASSVSFAYGRRVALSDVQLTVGAGEIFGLLGPNGGGKSTLFRLLSTLVPLQQGEVTVCGFDLRRQPGDIRQRLGVVFQSTCVDRQLTVLENLRCAGTLFGLSGKALLAKAERLLGDFGLAERANDRAGSLSGGQRRRLELAQVLLHEPEILLLDEPSTGLDPGARIDLWNQLRRLREQQGTTIVLTTHLLEEADKCDQLALLDAGRVVARGTPNELRASVGGESITLRTTEPELLADLIRQQYPLTPQTSPGEVRIETQEGARWIGILAQAFGDRIEVCMWGKPTLEDVFVARTGRRFRDSQEGTS